MNRPTLLIALGFLLGVASLSFNVGREIQVPVGGGRGPLMMSGLGPSEAAFGLSREEAVDARREFYFRQVEALDVSVSIPLLPQGPLSVDLRMDSTVRTRVDVIASGVTREGTFITSGPWSENRIATSVTLPTIDFRLRLQDAPLVQRSDPENFRRYVDAITVRSDDGFRLPWLSRIAGGATIAFLVMIAWASAIPMAPLLLILTGPLALAGFSFQDPVALALALPRLLGFAVAGALVAGFLGHKLEAPARDRAILAALGSLMVLAYGALSFLPNHSPADLDIHIWRTVDLADVPMSYDAWLRYGSHFPTPSQVRGSAAEALGDGPAIPYSPLPYVVFYAAHALGLDLHWSMNAIEALSLCLLLPLVFAFAREASSSAGGLLAAALVAMDLAMIHHLGRAHSPAVVGGALGLAGLLAFGITLRQPTDGGRWKTSALLLGLGALGYSSTPLFYALFGVALLVILMMQPAGRALVKPVSLSLIVGGALALILFYGHYIPGLVRGSGSSAMLSDPFPGRTFFIFHNESRQALRLWRLGLFIPFLAAIPAILMVAWKTPVAVRSFLIAWVAAWAGIMALKEPWGLPRLLRWAKEDFYVAPAVALLIAIAVSRIESRPLRIALTGVALVTAFVLRARDYGFHADTLRFLR